MSRLTENEIYFLGRKIEWQTFSPEITFHSAWFCNCVDDEFMTNCLRLFEYSCCETDSFKIRRFETNEKDEKWQMPHYIIRLVVFDSAFLGNIVMLIALECVFEFCLCLCDSVQNLHVLSAVSRSLNVTNLWFENTAQSDAIRSWNRESLLVFVSRYGCCSSPLYFVRENTRHWITITLLRTLSHEVKRRRVAPVPTCKCQ